MNTDFVAFDHVRQLRASATYPLARLVAHLPVSLVVAGHGLPPPRFVAATRPDAASDTSNSDF